jgi:hypothetical protein
MARYTARDAALVASELIRDGAPRTEIWRHAVLQLLDEYLSQVRRGDVASGVELFRDSPDPTGDRAVDAALAGLVEHLARRDGWQPPPWIDDPTRETLRFWFVDDLPGLRAWALRESPAAFRRRGVFIGENALERV